MASAVYSERFIKATIVAGGTASYVVPSGKRAVVVDITILPSSPAGYVQVTVAGTILVAWSAAAVLAILRWQGRAVLYAGETLQVAGVVSAHQCVISGYLLNVP